MDASTRVENEEPKRPTRVRKFLVQTHGSFTHCLIPGLLRVYPRSPVTICTQAFLLQSITGISLSVTATIWPPRRVPSLGCVSILIALPRAQLHLNMISYFSSGRI